jgi:uncharacterized small protein (DUF1192 family)
MEIARGVESVPDPNKFDLITHHWNRQGQLTRTNLYIMYIIEGNKYFERPVNSGNLWHENNQPAGRVEKTFGPNGVVAKKSFDYKAPHKAYTPKLEGNDALKYQVEQERDRIAELERELAAIKAERSGKPTSAPATQKKSEQIGSLAETLGKV